MPRRISEERTGKELIDPQFPRFLQEEFAGVVARHRTELVEVVDRLFES